MTDRRTPGPKPKDPNDRRSVSITVPLSPIENELIAQAAVAASMTKAEWARTMIVQAAKEISA